MKRLVCLLVLAALPALAGSANSAQRKQDVSAVLDQLLSGQLGLNQASSRLSYLGEDAWASTQIVVALRKETDARRHTLLVQALALVAVPGGDVETALLRAVGEEDLSVRMAAIRGLGRLRSQAAVPTLEAALSDRLLGVRREAAAALGAIRATRAAPALLKQARAEPDVETRVAMLLALGRTADQRAWPELEQFLASDSESTRLAAAQALCQLGDPKGPALARKLLASKERFERVQGVRLFEGATLKNAAPLLTPMLEDPSSAVRAVTGRVLFQAGDTSKLDWLVQESAKARGEERIPFESELEALHLSDEARRAILSRAGLR